MVVNLAAATYRFRLRPPVMFRSPPRRPSADRHLRLRDRLAPALRTPEGKVEGIVEPLEATVPAGRRGNEQVTVAGFERPGDVFEVVEDGFGVASSSAASSLGASTCPTRRSAIRSRLVRTLDAWRRMKNDLRPAGRR